MKSLLDIQQDIRDLELSAKEITKSIRSLHTDIENIRDSSDIAELATRSSACSRAAGLCTDRNVIKTASFWKTSFE